MPPAPIGERISYGPILMPEARAIGASNYSLRIACDDSGWIVGNPCLDFASGLPVIRPESGGKGYDFPRNWSSLLLVKGTGRIQSSASIPLRRAGILRRKRFQHHGGAHAAARRRASRIHS